MPKSRALSTDKEYADIGYEVPVTDSVKKTPNWVNLAQLDGPLDDSLANNLVYKVCNTEWTGCRFVNNSRCTNCSYEWFTTLQLASKHI